VPVGLAPPERVELIAAAGIAVFVASFAGADTDVAVPFTTVVDVIPAPHVLLEPVLLESPP
jgi:hypothetical protein